MAAAGGLEEAALAEGAAAAWKGLHLNLKWELSWKDELQRWQTKRRRMRR